LAPSSSETSGIGTVGLVSTSGSPIGAEARSGDGRGAAARGDHALGHHVEPTGDADVVACADRRHVQVAACGLDREGAPRCAGGEGRPAGSDHHTGAVGEDGAVREGERAGGHVALTPGVADAVLAAEVAQVALILRLVGQDPT
jgi:hypothetical protein